LSQKITFKRAKEEIRRQAARRASERARVARWDLDVAVFLFVVLIIVIILLFQNIGISIVAPVAIAGLIAVWIIGWRRGRRLYRIFYDEELARLEIGRRETEEEERRKQRIIEETVEETVQRALRDRWQ